MHGKWQSEESPFTQGGQYLTFEKLLVIWKKEDQGEKLCIHVCTIQCFACKGKIISAAKASNKKNYYADKINHSSPPHNNG